MFGAISQQNILARNKTDFDTLIEFGNSILFEYGKENKFEGKFNDLLERSYLNEETLRFFFKLIDDYINDANSNSTICFELLRIVGNIKEVKLFETRKNILLKALHNKEFVVRDGALTGLKLAHDKYCLPALNEAIEKEDNMWLKGQIKDLLIELENEKNEVKK